MMLERLFNIKSKEIFSTQKSSHGFSSEYVEMNSEILSIDQGHDLRDSLDLLDELNNLGCENIILTPTLNNNQPELSFEAIYDSFEKLKLFQSNQANLNNLNLRIAAEYHLDQNFEKVLETDKLISFQDGILKLKILDNVDFSFVKEMITEVLSRGFSPLLTFPEMHPHLHQDLARFYELKSWGAFFQINLLSLTPYHGENIQTITLWMLMNDLVDYVGSGIDKSFLQRRNITYKQPFELIKKELLEIVIRKNYHLLT